MEAPVRTKATFALADIVGCPMVAAAWQPASEPAQTFRNTFMR